MNNKYWILADGLSLEFEWQQVPQVTRTLLSILTDLENAVVWIVSTRPFISKSSHPCTNPIVTVLSARIPIGITVAFMFHSVFSSLARSMYLSLLSLFKTFHPMICRDRKVHYSAGSLFCWLIIYSSRVFHISISWWFFTGVWVTASLLKSPELVSVFWPSSAMLSFG